MEAACIWKYQRRGGDHRMGGCCLLKYPLLGQIHDVWNMKILGCVHGKAWNPSLAMVCFFTLASLHTGKHTQYVYLQVLWVSFSFTGLILLFYLVFYGFLAALFSFTMWAMLQTLNDDVPKYRDQIPSPGNYVVIIMASNKIGLYFIFSGSLYTAGRRC